MLTQGWIKLHRKLMDHWIWKNEKYFKAWVYMIFRANFDINKILIGSTVHDVEPGSFITSRYNFAVDTGLTEREVRTFWGLLEKDEMILKKSTSKMTKITVLNYASYQVERPTNDQPTTNQRPTNDQPTTIEKNVKNVKNEKEVYRKFAHLSISEKDFNKLSEVYEKSTIDNILDQIENYKQNKKYKSLYLTVKNWIKGEPKKRNTKW